MSSRTRSESPGGLSVESRSKRPRSSRMKACDRCVSGKLRCEDIQAAGCKRCRARKDGAPCSLSTIDETRAQMDHSAALLTEGLQAHTLSIEQQEQRITELNSRVMWLEQQLAQVTPSSASGQAGSTLVASRAGSVINTNIQPSNEPWSAHYRVPSRDANNSKFRAEWRCNWYDLIENQHKISPEFGQARFEFTPVLPALCSPVELGLATETEYEVAFLRVHRDIPALLPLYPINKLHCAQSTDPLGVISVLLQNPASRIELFDQLDEMTRTQHGRPVDSESLLAHLLLSFAPVHQNLHDARPEAIDVLGSIYEHGSRVGLEMLSVRALTRKTNWGEEWYEHLVQRCLLWEMTKARYSLMKIFWCPSITELPLPNVHLFPEKGPTEAINATQQYLRRLHHLISLVKPLAQELIELEQESIDTCPPKEKFANYGEKWKALDRQITEAQQEWKVKRDLLFYDTHLISLWFLLRTTIFYQRLHTPLHPDILIAGVQFIGACFLAMSRRIIDILLDIPTDPSVGPTMAQLPHYAIKMMIFAVISARRALRYSAARGHVITHEYINVPKLEEVERRLEELGGVVGDLFADMRERRVQAEALLSLSVNPVQDGGLGSEIQGQGQAQGAEMEDWFSLDFNAWLASSDTFMANLTPSQGLVLPQ